MHASCTQLFGDDENENENHKHKCGLQFTFEDALAATQAQLDHRIELRVRRAALLGLVNNGQRHESDQTRHRRGHENAATGSRRGHVFLRQVRHRMVVHVIIMVLHVESTVTDGVGMTARIHLKEVLS